MFTKNSPVKPSIIHTNAVLRVCALAHDVDAILGIAAELPTHGSGAPDNVTFTTILNAIRSKALAETDAQEPTSRGEDAGRNDVIALAVQQGRRIWREVRQRWLSGDLRLDEEFVCAMGRLLLLGDAARDHDDVLSLLEQTMGITRQIARIANVASEIAEEDAGLYENPELPPHLPANVELETLLSSSTKEDFHNLFAPLPSTAGPSKSVVHPGRNTLSLVLDACIRLKYPRAAQNYWGKLTSPDGYHKIIPDSENYHMYLRLLRLQRSSRLTVDLVNEMRSGKLAGMAGAVQTKTFRIALSCCVRDIKNKNSIVHAGILVRTMTDTLPYPDARALSMYLQLALHQKPRDWRTIMGVIRDIELGVRNLRSLLAYDPAGSRKQKDGDILNLVRELVRAFDVVLHLGNEEMYDREKRRCKQQKNTLMAYLTRTHSRLGAEDQTAQLGKGDEGGRGMEVSFSKKSRSGTRSDDHQHHADEEGENDVFDGESDEAVAPRPVEDKAVGAWKDGGRGKRPWQGRVQKWDYKDRETRDGERWRMQKWEYPDLDKRDRERKERAGTVRDWRWRRQKWEYPDLDKRDRERKERAGTVRDWRFQGGGSQDGQKGAERDHRRGLLGSQPMFISP